MNTQISDNDGAQSGASLPPRNGSALVPPPKYNPRDSMRLVKRVEPGWPQAHYVLTCGHAISVPTWANGRTKPKPRSKWYRCFKCQKSKGWGHRFHQWFEAHFDAWNAAHPDGQNDQAQRRPVSAGLSGKMMSNEE